MLLLRVMIVGSEKERWYAFTRYSAPAFEAAYGLVGSNNEPS